MWSYIETYSLQVYNIERLKKFYENYPNQEIAERLKEYEDCFPFYRRIMGDGNCFYRSFAFLLLRNCKYVDNLEELFPRVDFLCEIPSSSSFSRSDYYNHLMRYWNRQIKGIIIKERVEEKEKDIQNLFNEDSGLFDSLIIGYLRSLNVLNLIRNKYKYRDYVEDEEEWEEKLRGIQHYGRDAEEIEIFSLADFFRVGMTIIEVKQTSVQPIHFDGFQNKGYFMILRSGHYEIIYPANDNYSHIYQLDEPINVKEKLLQKKSSSKLIESPSRQQKTSKIFINSTPKPPPSQNDFFDFSKKKSSQKKQMKVEPIFKYNKVDQIEPGSKIPAQKYEAYVRDSGFYIHKFGVQVFSLGLLAGLVYMFLM